MLEFQSILCGTVLPEFEEDVLCHALRLAQMGRCELILAHSDAEALHMRGQHLPELHERLVRWGTLSPDAGPEAWRELGLRTSILHVPDGPSGLAKLVARRRPDLLVLGTIRQPGLGRWVEPATAQTMAQVARVPTLFVPVGAGGLVSSATGDLRLGRVLIPLASWPDASVAVHEAQCMAATLKLSRLHYRTLHVGPRAEVPTIERMRDGALWDHTDRQGSVVDIIQEEADKFGADLVAMTTGNREVLGSRLFGHTVEQVVQRVGCPVLVAPQTG